MVGNDGVGEAYVDLKKKSDFAFIYLFFWLGVLHYHHVSLGLRPKGSLKKKKKKIPWEDWEGVIQKENGKRKEREDKGNLWLFLLGSQAFPRC